MKSCRLLGFCLFVLAAGSGQAQDLPDPTRPPTAFDAGPAAPAAATGLQSIIRRQGGKPAAVINGTYVEQDGRIGTARLVAVGEDSVILEGDGGREVLYLTPGIEKTRPAAARADHAAPQSAGERKKP